MKAIELTSKLIIFLLILLLLGCSQKRPVLYPNSHLQYVGKEAAEADIDECIRLAKDYGADSDKGTEIAKSSAKGAAVGAATGAAVGAVAGNLSRGAAAGAAGGLPPAVPARRFDPEIPIRCLSALWKNA